MHILRKVAAILTGVAALIGGASIAAGANAADSTPFKTDELAKDQSITVQATASDANLTGSTFKAVPLAYYSQGAYTGPDSNKQIVSYDLADAGLKDAINTALSNSGNTVPDDDKEDPMVWVAQHLYQPDSTAYPWSGKLRDFLDQLKNVDAFKNATGTPLTVSGKSATASVKPGIYAIVDTTNTEGKAGAIIALNGTGINGITKLANSKDPSNPWILGTVDYKANTDHGDVTDVVKHVTAVDKHGKIHYNKYNQGSSADAAIGSTVTFQITSHVPNWTGYKDFRYQIVDTPHKALTFNTDPHSVKVTVDGAKKNPLVNGTDYTFSQDPTTKDVTFKFGDATGNIVADKANFPEGATVTVTYTATVNKYAVSGLYQEELLNEAKVKYSHNPNNSSDLITYGDSQLQVNTGHVNVLKTDMNKKPLAGAKFDLLETDGKTAVNVVATNTAKGQYRLADKTEKDAKNEVTSASCKDDNGNTIPNCNIGTISIDGLYGSYDLKETESPLGSPVLANVTFTVDNSSVLSATDANNLASVDTTNADQIDILNARNLLEMPKTGAAGILMNVIIALLLVAAGVTALLVHRHNVKKAASAK